jgi:hypothetical protein
MMMIDDPTELGDEGTDRGFRRRQRVRNRPVRVSILTRGLLGGLLAAVVAVGVLLAPQEGSRLARGPAVVRLAGNGTLVSTLGFSPDGWTLAAGYSGGELRFWDVATQSSRTVRSSQSVISSLTFAPDGRSLALADHGSAIHRYDPATLEPLSPLEAPGYRFTSVCFSHDGCTLAAGAADGRVALWDVALGRIRTVLAGHQGMIGVLAFSHDDRTLASGGGIDGTIRLWNIAEGGPPRILPGHPTPVVTSMYRVLSLAFSADDRLLASGGGFDPYARLWDARSGEAVGSWRLAPSAGLVSYVAFTAPLAVPDGVESIAHATVRQWKTGGGSALLAGYCSRSLQIKMTHDGRGLAIANWSDILVWNLRHGPRQSPAGQGLP